MTTPDNLNPENAAQAAPSAVVPPVATAVGWNELGLDPEVLTVIESAGYKSPTPVQAQSIPIALERHDLVASAQTGTGKTAAFTLPMIQSFRGRQGTFGLVLAPTREIAQQIHQTVETLGGPLGVRSIVLIGGVDYRADTIALNTYPQIIVATPGRLCDHLDRGNIWLDYIEAVVLDEADRMLDMGFSTQLNRIMDDVPKTRQTLLFSATFPQAVQRFADRILHEPKRVTIGRPLSAATTVDQRAIPCEDAEKFRLLMRLLRNERGSIMVFTRSKEGATRLWRSLHSAGVYDATYIHSDRLQSHREQALADFKSGKFRILVATDVAGRGIHVDAVAHVVNYELPMEPEDYVHRIGRTGRAGQTGRSTTYFTARDRSTLKQIEKLVGREIPAEFEINTSGASPEGQGQGQRREGERDRNRDRQGGRGRRFNKDRKGRPTPGDAPSGVITPVNSEGALPPLNGMPLEGEFSDDEDLNDQDGLEAAEGQGPQAGDEPENNAPRPFTSDDPNQQRRRKRRRGGRGRNKRRFEGGAPGAAPGGPVPVTHSGNGSGQGPSPISANGAEGGSPSASHSPSEGGEGGGSFAGGSGGPDGPRKNARRRRRRGRRGPRPEGGGNGGSGGQPPAGGGPVNAE